MRVYLPVQANKFSGSIRNLYGSLWSKDRKQWSIPATEIYNAIRTFDRKSPRIAEMLANSEKYSQARLEYRRLKRNISLSTAKDANIDIPAPNGKQYFPYQRAGINYAKNFRNCLIGDDMGLGKTIQAIGLANYFNLKKILVICPASVKLNWQDEANSWLTLNLTPEVINSKTDVDMISGKVRESNGFWIINYDILKKFKKALSIKWDLLVVDECHMVKNEDAKRSKYTFELVSNAKQSLFLTGTPLVNRPIDIWPVASRMNPSVWCSVKQFGIWFCDGQETEMGWDFSGHSNLRGLQNRLRATGMLRRLKSEVIKDLPPKRRQVIEIPKEGFERVLDREREANKKFRKLVKDVSDESGYNQAILRMDEQSFPDIAEIAKIRHETAVKKAPKVIEFIEDLTSNTGKIVIMCHHKDVVNIFKKHYGESCVTFTGAESASKKYEAERKFREDPNVHYFVASIKAAGLGINLTVSDMIVFAELDWVPASITQSEDRLHRIGQQNSVMAYHVVLEKSIDCTLARRIVEKQQVIEQAVNRREE